MFSSLVVTRELLGSPDNSDQRNPAILSSSNHGWKDTSLQHHPSPKERSSITPNVRKSPSARTHCTSFPSPPNVKYQPEGSQRTDYQDRNVETTCARERVDDLEASIDVIDGLVTSLSDFAMRSKVGKISEERCGSISYECRW